MKKYFLGKCYTKMVLLSFLFLIALIAVGQRDASAEKSRPEFHAEKVEDAICIAPIILDNYTNSVRNGKEYELDFKPSVTSVAVDATDTSRVGFGGSGIYLNNPSIASKQFSSASEYVEFYRSVLTDEYIDELVASKPLYFAEKNIDSIKTEMGKLRTIIQKTKDVATSKSKYYSNDKSEPSMQKNWLVENCAEVWAVRDAILQGGKIDNLVLRSVDVATGSVKPFCNNCKLTFKDFIKSMK